MTLSAKWTSLSILAIAALGAVACTVTSGTVDDSNGGTGSNTDVDSGDSETADSGADSNADAAVGTCEGNKQENALVSMDCQACLEQSCCTELKGCFNVDPGKDDAGTANPGCNDYVACVSNCNSTSTTQEEADACIKDTCRAAVGDTIANAFDAILSCGHTKGCGTTCGIE